MTRRDAQPYMEEIGEEFSVSLTTVRHWARALRLSPRPPPP